MVKVNIANESIDPSKGYEQSLPMNQVIIPDDSLHHRRRFG